MLDSEKDKVPCLFNRREICPFECGLHDQARDFYKETLEQRLLPGERTRNIFNNLVRVLSLREARESKKCEHHKQNAT